MAESNQLWILSLVAVVGIVAMVMMTTTRDSGTQYLRTPSTEYASTIEPTQEEIRALEAFTGESDSNLRGQAIMQSGLFNGCELFNREGDTTYWFCWYKSGNGNIKCTNGQCAEY